MIRILLQTTIPYEEDNWNINRFSLLREHLASAKDENGEPLFEVVARDREADENGDDPVLSKLAESDFDEIWLIAADAGDGLSEEDCKGITAFRKRGGGILSMRDHQDLGSSLCTIGGVGKAHFFHSKQQDPDVSNQTRDDEETTTISWPNYHSGSNGDSQKINIVESPHEVFRRNNGTDELIEFFPAHPHEGGVGVPADLAHARVIATGTSKTTNRPFNLIVAFDEVKNDGKNLGRAFAHSSFHHFVDYNWDINMGCPTFLTEAPGDEMKSNPRVLEDIKTYVRNAALWLANAEGEKNQRWNQRVNTSKA